MCLASAVAAFCVYVDMDASSSMQQVSLVQVSARQVLVMKMVPFLLRLVLYLRTPYGQLHRPDPACKVFHRIPIQPKHGLLIRTLEPVKFGMFIVCKLYKNTRLLTRKDNA